MIISSLLFYTSLSILTSLTWWNVPAPLQLNCTASDGRLGGAWERADWHVFTVALSLARIIFAVRSQLPSTWVYTATTPADCDIKTLSQRLYSQDTNYAKWWPNKFQVLCGLLSTLTSLTCLYYQWHCGASVSECMYEISYVEQLYVQDCHQNVTSYMRTAQVTEYHIKSKLSHNYAQHRVRLAEAV